MSGSISRARLLLAACVCLALASAAAREWSRGSLSFGFCRLVFQYQLANESDELDREAASGSSEVYYFTSYYLNGVLSAFEATGDERLLRRAIAVMDTMTATARDFESGGRVYRVWGPFAITADSPVPRPILHYTLQAMVPLARAAAIIRADPSLRRRYGQAADRYVEFADGCIIRYFYRGQLSSRIPWLDPDHFPLWNDNAANFALDAAFLCRATGRTLPCSIARGIGEGFKSKMRPYKSGWTWDNQTIPIGSDAGDAPGSVGNQAGVPDVSGANVEVSLVVTLYEMGLVFTRADVDRMAATLSDTIWNGSLADPRFSNYLNGSDAPYRVYLDPGLNGSVYHGWALMGGYSPKAEAALFAALEAIVRGKTNPSLERNAKSYGGLLALAGHLLRNQAMTSARPSPRPPRSS